MGVKARPGLLALWQELRDLAPSDRLEGLLSLQSEAEYLETLDLVAREMADAAWGKV
jgi:hypothetical protein